MQSGYMALHRSNVGVFFCKDDEKIALSRSFGLFESEGETVETLDSFLFGFIHYVGINHGFMKAGVA